jgi:hypothetical protein
MVSLCTTLHRALNKLSICTLHAPVNSRSALCVTVTLAMLTHCQYDTMLLAITEL